MAQWYVSHSSNPNDDTYKECRTSFGKHIRSGFLDYFEYMLMDKLVRASHDLNYIARMLIRFEKENRIKHHSSRSKIPKPELVDEDL